jgi:hypothetical protein
MDQKQAKGSASSSSLDKKILAGIDRICVELKLSELVQSRSLELLNLLKPAADDKKPEQFPDSVANAVACALVSLAHEEAWRMRRVPRHLPDRFIGRTYGLSSSTVVYNKHLIHSIIAKKKISEQKKTHRSTRTLR